MIWINNICILSVRSENAIIIYFNNYFNKKYTLHIIVIQFKITFHPRKVDFNINTQWGEFKHYSKFCLLEIFEGPISYWSNLKCLLWLVVCINGIDVRILKWIKVRNQVIMWSYIF